MPHSSSKREKKLGVMEIQGFDKLQDRWFRFLDTSYVLGKTGREYCISAEPFSLGKKIRLHHFAPPQLPNTTVCFMDLQSSVTLWNIL